MAPYLLQVLGRMMPQGLGILVSAAIVQFAGPESFGRFALATSVAGFGFGVLAASADLHLQRSSNPEHAARVVGFKLASWMCLLPVTLVIGIGLRVSTGVALLAAIVVMLQQVLATYVVLLRMQGRDAASIVPRLIPPLAFLALLVTVKPHYDWEVATLAVIGAISGLLVARGTLRCPLWNGVHRFFSEVKSLSPLWGSQFISQVYGTLDVMLIGHALNPESVAQYRVAYSFAMAAIPAAGAISFVYLTQASRVSLMELGRLWRRQVAAMIAFGIAVIAGMHLVYPLVAQSLYGRLGMDSASVGKVLGYAAALNMICMAGSYTLLVMRQDRMLLRLNLMGVAVFVVFAPCMVAWYGVFGVGLSLMTSYAIQAVLFAVSVARLLRAGARGSPAETLGPLASSA